MNTVVSTADRFFKKVNKTAPNGCWEWTAAKDPKGYGRFNMGRTSVPAHRVSWIITKGGVREGMMLCHKCDNRACCNPDHLYEGTHEDNVRDMVSRRRFEHGERHHSSRLTTQEVHEIRSIEGVRYSCLAELYGVSKSLIYLIRSRRTRAFE